MREHSFARTAWRLLAVVGLVLPVLAWLLSQSVRWNLERACVLRDTPYLDFCEATPKPVADQIAQLKTRIAQNPGDSAAYVALASVKSGTTGSGSAVADGEAAMRAAITLAPHDPDLLRQRIDEFARKGEWRLALPLLVELAEFHTDWGAAKVLSSWIHLDGRVALELTGYVKRDSRWVGLVLQSFPIVGLSYSNALPLVSDAWAKGVVSAQDLGLVIRRLKTEGHWMDAYSLWQLQNATPLGPLYNPDFESPIQADGFDWELTGSTRGGAIAQQISMGSRGFVLGVTYSGRPISAPPARQQLFLYEGVYRLEFEFAVEKLRSESGLAWVARCESGGAELGRSAPLLDTQGQWRTHRFEFRVPRTCLSVVNLQLETAAAFEMTSGVGGRAYFDSLQLKRLGTNALP